MPKTPHLCLVANPDWCLLDGLDDRTVFQTREWLEFVAETQDARPIVAEVLKGDERVGWFTGLIVRKFGLKLLGSPFPGWTTSYMGFNLGAETDRAELLEALFRFAFRQLGCIHVESMDRRLTTVGVVGKGITHRVFRGYEIDLTLPEDNLLANMSSACRRCIRKAGREGLTIEPATDSKFAVEYYEQLSEVFKGQGLVPTYSLGRVESLIRHILPTGRLLLLRARDPEGKCIGTGIFPAMNDTMYFWGGASWREYQILRPNEAIHWYAMRYWKQRGITRYDMGGGGDYKKKYGGIEIAVPWIRKSRHPFFPLLRELGRIAFNVRQRLSGQL